MKAGGHRLIKIKFSDVCKAFGALEDEFSFCRVGGFGSLKLSWLSLMVMPLLFFAGRGKILKHACLRYFTIIKYLHQRCRICLPVPACYAHDLVLEILYDTPALDPDAACHSAHDGFGTRALSSYWSDSPPQVCRMF